MYINRNVGTILKHLSLQYPVLLLTGPRQVGKTTVLEHVFPHAEYVTLDYARNAEQAESRPQEFLDRFSCPS